MTNKQCPNCNRQYGSGAYFCINCGRGLTPELKLDIVGIPEGEKKFTIKFKVLVEVEHTNFEHALDIVAERLSDVEPYFDNVMEGYLSSREKVSEEILETKETHPYYCSTCRNREASEEIVSKTEKGRCTMCNIQNWRERATDESSGIGS